MPGFQVEITDRGSDGRLGSYGVNLMSGTMAAGLAAGAEVFQFRWTDPTKAGLIKQVSLWAGSIGAFTAGFCAFEFVPARAWTADGSGGTAATLTTNNGKLRTSHPTTVLGAARIASTAALTAGTKTLDAQGLVSAGGSVTATAGTPLLPPTALIQPYGFFFPLVLAQNEGFVIKATVPATGTWTLGVSVLWDEATTFPAP
jgi:hypothetical protein